MSDAKRGGFLVPKYVVPFVERLTARKKPRIQKAWMPCVELRLTIWVCSGDGHQGMGPTPRAAYEQWAEQQ